MRYGIYRNSEGYSDPTAGAAMRNILRDERKKRRRTSEKHKRQLQQTKSQKTEPVTKEAVSNDD